MNGFRIYKTTDKIEVKIDSVSFIVSPLTYGQKCELQPLICAGASGCMKSAMQAVIQSFKFSLKGVKNLKTFDDDNNEVDYILEFDDNNQVKDSCIDDLLNLPMSNKLSSLCTSLLTGLTSKICDMNGNPIEGIEFIGKVKEEKK